MNKHLLSLFFTLLTMVSNIALAKTDSVPEDIQIQSKHDQILISLKNKNFHFKSNSREINKVVKDCEVIAYKNLLLIARAKVMENPTRYAKPPKSADFFTVSIGKDKYYVAPLSKEGSYLKRINTKIDYVIAEGAVRCSQK